MSELSVVLPSSNTSSLSLSLHPLPILNISEHLTRLRLQTNNSSPFVLGALLGTQNGRQVEIVNTFELAITQESDIKQVDHGFFVSRRDQYKQVFPSLEFIGWYTVAHHPVAEHIALHEQFVPYTPNPLLLVLQPTSTESQALPVKAYEPTVEIRDRKSRSVFIEVGYKVETGEAERIAVDWSAKGGEGGGSLTSHLQTQRAAVQMLHSRILLLTSYVTAVAEGKAKVDHTALRSIQALVASLPASENKRFREEFDTEYADVQLTAYLSTLTKSTHTLNDVVDKHSLLSARENESGRAGRMGAGRRGLGRMGHSHVFPTPIRNVSRLARTHTDKTLEELLKLLPDSERSKAQVLLLQGERTTYRNDTDRELSFRQESNFFYLTGCNLPASTLVVLYTPDTLETILFIPPEDPLETMWSPPPPSLSDASHQFQASKIVHTSSLSSVLESLARDHPSALFHVLPSSPLFPALLPQAITPSLAAGKCTEYLLPALHQARLTKTAAEIALMRKANEISSRAHEVVMRLLGQGIKDGGRREATTGNVILPSAWRISKEAEAEAVFVASCRREGAVHQAYLPIVAASTRASTLHYCCNDREFSWGPQTHSTSDIAHEDGPCTFTPQVLLIDAGCEWSNYASDITRTTPVGNGGKFTPEARAIYSLVLKMQIDAINALKPGLHWDLVQLQCHKILVRGFIDLGIFKGTEDDLLASGISAAFFPHGVGHSIGLDVHDVPSASKPSNNPTIPASSQSNPVFYTYLRLRLPLQAGMVVTVEPGIYFSPHLLKPVRNSTLIDHEVLARYENVGGVRIEDVVLLTEAGSEVLSTVGKAVDWLEAVASGEHPA